MPRFNTARIKQLSSCAAAAGFRRPNYRVTNVQAGGNWPEKCDFKLTPAEDGAEAKVKIKNNKLEVESKNALPDTLYTVWIDYRSRAGVAQGQSTAEAMADDYPIPLNGMDLSNTGPGTGRGVAPAFATTQGVTSGKSLDANGIITKKNAKGKLKIELDYDLLQPGASPVVAADLVNQDDDTFLRWKQT